MNNKWKSRINGLITLLLRLGFFAYILFTVQPFLLQSGVESDLFDWITRWVLIILLGIILLYALIVRRSNFFRHGFIAIIIAALFNLFQALLMNESVVNALVHFYVIVTAFYFVSRDLRMKVRKGKVHHRSSDRNH